jgi:type I restriction enzyme, S subunit
MDRGFRHSECRDFSWDWRNVVMNGWKTSELGEIAVIIYGYTAKASGENIGPKFLRITDIQDEMVDWSSVPYCPINEDDFKRHKLIDQDIVFARTGATTGKSYLVSNPPKSVAASYLIRLRIKDSNISAEFVSKYFQTYEYWNSISSGISGSAQGGFNASKLSALVIPIPPLSEQKRIVAIVDEAFESIDIAIENTQKNLANARELFDSYLNDIFTEQNASWQENRIEDVCEAIVDCINKTASVIDEQSPFKMIRTTNIRNGHVNLESVRYVTEETYYQWIRRQTPRKGDVLLTREAPMGEVGMLMTDEYVFLGQRIVSYRTDPEKLNNKFLLYAFQSNRLQNQIKAFASGSTVQHMRVPDTKALRIPVPSILDQMQVVQNLDILLTETQRLEAIYQEKLAALTELKQSILQKAFTGELTADNTNQTTKKAKEVIAA